MPVRLHKNQKLVDHENQAHILFLSIFYLSQNMQPWWYPVYALHCQYVGLPHALHKIKCFAWTIKSICLLSLLTVRHKQECLHFIAKLNALIKEESSSLSLLLAMHLHFACIIFIKSCIFSLPGYIQFCGLYWSICSDNLIIEIHGRSSCDYLLHPCATLHTMPPWCIPSTCRMPLQCS